MVGRNSCLFEAFFTGACFPCKMLHEQLWKVLSFTGEVSTTVNLKRREHADVRLLITTHADNKHLFDGKATNKDSFEKIAEQFTNASGFLVKRRRGACKRMGLVTNGTLFSQTENPRIPNRNFPKFFVNGKHPGIHRERNHGSTTSTRPITVHERTAMCKSQLEPIIESTGNTRGAEQAFGSWFADGLYRSLVSSATQASNILHTSHFGLRY